MDIEPPEVFVSPLMEDFKCPICLELLRSPVILIECAHTFCSNCFDRSIELSNTSCATCRAQICSKPNPNRVLANLIDNLLVHCKYSLRYNESAREWVVDENLCKATLKRSQRKQHEINCKFRPQRCVHSHRGCNFKGAAYQVDAHLTNDCYFEKLKVYFDHNEETIDKLKEKIRNQENEMDRLKSQMQTILKTLSNVSNVANSALAAASTPPTPTKSQSPQLISLLPSNLDLSESNQQQLSSNGNLTSLQNYSNNNSIHDEKRIPAKEERSNNRSTEEKKSEKAFRKVLLQDTISCKKTLTSHDDTVEALVVYKDSLFSASWDHTIKIWSMEDWECMHTLTCNTDVRELVIDQDRLYSGCGSGAIQVFDINTRQCIKTVRKHSDDVLTMKMTNNRLFTGSSDNTIKVWRPDKMECVADLVGHSNWVFAVEGSTTNDMVFSGSSDQTVKVWCPERLSCITTLTGHTDQVRALAVTDNVLFTGSYDCTAKVWDLRTMKCVQTLHVNNEVFGLGAYCGYLFSGDENGTIKIWDMSALRCMHTLSQHCGSVYALIHANGRLLSASSDTTIKVWE